MRPCPPPKGEALPLRKKAVLEVVLDCLQLKEYKKSLLDPLVPRLAQHWADTCQTDEDFRAWLEELAVWVRWRRAQGLWLSYIFQHVTRQCRSLYHFAACDLYSDAQAAYADDLCLNSLETALSGLDQNRSALGDPFKPVEDHILHKLYNYYSYYYAWCRPFAYADCNPCAQHFCTYLDEWRLSAEMAGRSGGFSVKDEAALREIIQSCSDENTLYYRILAGKFLGLWLEGQGRYADSAEAFAAALALARQYGLDTQIGHLLRHYGCALRGLKNFAAARDQFQLALEFEREYSCETCYWQALSARELGDTLVRLAGQDASFPSGRPPGFTAVAIADVNQLAPALEAYRASRGYFDRHLALQSPFPVARAAKQQIFRSFSENAIRTAAALSSSSDILAEAEAAGPREATEVAAWIAASRQLDRMASARLRQNRVRVYRELNTIPGGFDAYRQSLAGHWQERREFLSAAIALAPHRLQALSVDEAARQVMDLRIKDTAFLLFHVGVTSSTAVLLDASSGILATIPLDCGEEHLEMLHRKYVAEMALSSPVPREVALENLLLAYESLLAPVLQPVARFLSGKQLKIFPRLQMNALPFHALRVAGRYLGDICDISYSPTLGLFLETHTCLSAAPRAADLGVVLGDDVVWYEGLWPALADTFGERARVVRQPAAGELFTQTFLADPPRDVLFACHGHFYFERSDESYLRLSARETVNFSELQGGLDLRGVRSVIMGACESGLVRSAVGAEYIGLTGAMLGSGVRYVVGALWRVNELATVVLLERYLELTRDGQMGLPSALARAQRELMVMPREQLIEWVRRRLPESHRPKETLIIDEVARLGEHPFAHPYMWAGLQVVGDI